MIRRLVISATTLFLAGLPAPSFAGVATTKHNLSLTGPGTVKAATETEICIFCHAAHNTSPTAPLWNHAMGGTTYIPYSSSTTRSAPGQPNGASLLCLSCHDGTVALGDVLSRATPITMAGGVTRMPAGASNLGVNLSDDHPVSFPYTAGLASTRGELNDPSALTGRVKLDASGRMQCTSCHDAHDDPYGKFLVIPNSASALCTTCHLKNFWASSDHRNSTATWSGAAPDPWPNSAETTVAGNACENCHRPHTAPEPRRLLSASIEEDVCYVCHNGHMTPPTKNIQTEFAKTSRHPVANTSGVHDPAEASVATSRHAECADCHNPHAARAGAGTPSGPLAGVRGITLAGTDVNPVTQEYQICFRCHADSPGIPAPRTTRQHGQTNTRLEFQTTNPSYHPVAGAGRNPNVPSLISPWTTSSVMRCTDCHDNNAGPVAGGSGPRGPHGSTYAPLLVRQYVTTDNASESAANYALCYSCHSRSSILGNASFGEHNKHIAGERSPCNICHDPHGVSGTQGNSTNNSKLINFDTSVVRPSSSGILRFESTGTYRGRCYLTCHGQNHNPESY